VARIFDGSYGIIRQGGGHIQIDSAPGKGTSVKIFLPQVEGSPRPVDSNKALPKVTQGGETILLAEDEANVRGLICELLQAQGYTVLPCANGREALETCERHPGKIDLLVTDVVMPGMSGPELADAVQAARPKTPELFMSGYMGGSTAEEKVIARGAPLIGKPFTAKTLATQVRAALDGVK